VCLSCALARHGEQQRVVRRELPPTHPIGSGHVGDQRSRQDVIRHRFLAGPGKGRRAAIRLLAHFKHATRVVKDRVSRQSGRARATCAARRPSRWGSDRCRPAGEFEGVREGESLRYLGDALSGFRLTERTGRRSGGGCGSGVGPITSWVGGNL